MLDVIKVFIRTERLADHNGHLSCIIARMLDIFASVKGAWLYCQLMKELKTACLQGHLDCSQQSCCPLLQQWVVQQLVWYVHWADINKGSQVRRWTEQRENEKLVFLATSAGFSPTVISLMSTIGWSKTSGNMLHSTETLTKHNGVFVVKYDR